MTDCYLQHCNLISNHTLFFCHSYCPKFDSLWCPQEDSNYFCDCKLTNKDQITKNCRSPLQSFILQLTYSSERILIWCSCGTKAEIFELSGATANQPPLIDFIRGTLAGKLDSFRLNFRLNNFCNFSVSDECESVTNDFLQLPLLNPVKSRSVCNWQNVFVSSSLIFSDNVQCPASAYSILLTIGNLWSTCMLVYHFQQYNYTALVKRCFLICEL